MTTAIVQGIINRYLQKWLKNVTTEHAALTTGEAVFKNVELRLDVLQEELGLPVVFTRGFIQELRVYVPVAGLLRENIRFTLSNVELVSSSPESWQTPKRAGSKAPGRREEGRRAAGDSDKEHDAGGWAKSMMNRIALNIRVEVRNMVFKFRTDKYVSSVSWQSLTFDPCDPSWRAGFVNVSGETKAAFKTLTLKQVTWCLDAVGNDLHRSYEAPIFNRQNVTVRILSRSRPAAAQQHPALGVPAVFPAVHVDVRLEDVLLSLSVNQVGMASLLLDEVLAMVHHLKASSSKHGPASAPPVPGSP